MKVKVNFLDIYKDNKIVAIKIYRWLHSYHTSFPLRDSKQALEDIAENQTSYTIIETDWTMDEINNTLHNDRSYSDRLDLIQIIPFDFRPCSGTFSIDHNGDCDITVERGDNHLHLVASLDKISEVLTNFNNLCNLDRRQS